MSRINNLRSKIESLDAEEQDNCIIDDDVDVGIPIATFSFGAKPEAVMQPVTAAPKSSFSFRAKAQRGITPAVDGESYTIKRCYQYRLSTLRKLNELKANHSDVNVYLNTIIDKAISYYYDYVFSRSSS